MQRSTPRGKDRIVWIVKLALALLFLYVLIHNISFDAISLAFAGAYMPYIFAALLLLPLNIWLQYRKWAVMLRSVYPSVPASEVRSSLLLGFSFGLATPARIGEFGGTVQPVQIMGPMPNPFHFRIPVSQFIHCHGNDPVTWLQDMEFNFFAQRGPYCEYT